MTIKNIKELRVPWNKGIKQWPDGLPRSITDKISQKLRGRSQSKEHVRKRIESRMHSINQDDLKKSAKELGHKNRGRTHIRSSDYKKLQSNVQTKYWSSEQGNIRKLEMMKKRKGIPRSPEMQKLLKNNRQNQIFPKEDNKPERMMQIALSLNGIKFEKQKLFKIANTSHRVDIFIEPNICLEVDGDHWHANPNYYGSEDIIIGKKTAKDVWARDTLINHELNRQGYHVIRVWVTDMENNFDNCISKIINLINNCKEIIIQ